MNEWIQRLTRPANLGAVSFTVLCWVLAVFALADPDLSRGMFAGGAKTLFVVLAVLMTLITFVKLRGQSGSR